MLFPCTDTAQTEMSRVSSRHSVKNVCSPPQPSSRILSSSWSCYYYYYYDYDNYYFYYYCLVLERCVCCCLGVFSNRCCLALQNIAASSWISLAAFVVSS